MISRKVLDISATQDKSATLQSSWTGLIDAQFQATDLRREKMGTSVDETPVKIVHKQVYLE